MSDSIHTHTHTHPGEKHFLYLLFTSTFDCHKMYYDLRWKRKEKKISYNNNKRGDAVIDPHKWYAKSCHYFHMRWFQIEHKFGFFSSDFIKMWLWLCHIKCGCVCGVWKPTLNFFWVITWTLPFNKIACNCGGGGGGGCCLFILCLNLCFTHFDGFFEVAIIKNLHTKKR